ncbi:hypothetical protein B0F90DRAFT_1775598, partial [Multifurca ochricompacta]
MGLKKRTLLLLHYLSLQRKVFIYLFIIYYVSYTERTIPYPTPTKCPNFIRIFYLFIHHRGEEEEKKKGRKRLSREKRNNRTTLVFLILLLHNYICIQYQIN